MLAALWLGGVGVAAACDFATPSDNVPPVYPVEELWRLSNHTVTVVLEADGCGVPLSATLERSSGITALDERALEAARRWVIPEQWRGRPRYRLPFDFSALPLELAERTGERVRDVFFDERRSGVVQLADVPAHSGADGLPGYLHDPYPIGYFSLREALDSLTRVGVVKRYDGVVDIWIRDEEGVSLFQWYGPLLVRNRQVQQDGMTLVVSSALCADDLLACRQQLGRVQAARGRQLPVRLPTTAH